MHFGVHKAHCDFRCSRDVPYLTSALMFQLTALGITRVNICLHLYLYCVEFCAHKCRISIKKISGKYENNYTHHLVKIKK